MERLRPPPDLLTEPVGVVGLGIMGGAMGRNLLADGFRVLGHDVSEPALTALSQAGGTPLRTPAQVAGGAGVVITSLPTGTALEAVVGGLGGLRDAARPGLVVVETSTIALADKESARQVISETGGLLLDCPISGTGAQAASREIVFLASGDPTAIARVRPVLEQLGRRIHEVGPFGAGSRLKYAANLLVGIHNVATAEAFVLAEKAGLDAHLVHDVLADSAAASRILELRMPMMIANEYSPPTARLNTFLKDLEIITEFADQLGSPTPLLRVVRQLYEAASRSGLGELDSAAVCRLIEARADIDRGAPTP